MSTFLDDFDLDPKEEEAKKARIKREGTRISRFQALKVTSYTFMLALFGISVLMVATFKETPPTFYGLIMYIFLLLASEIYFEKKKTKTPGFVFESGRRSAGFTFVRYYAYMVADVSGLFILGILQYSFIKNGFFAEDYPVFFTYLPFATACLCALTYLFSRLCIREYTHPQ